MIENPWPLKWSCPDADWRLKRFCCPYSERYSLPCGTQRNECESCYMKQLSLGDHYNRLTYFSGRDKVVHICDRCGQVVKNLDLMVYLDVTDRSGATAIRQELCYDCAIELVDWAEKKGEEESL